MTPSLRSTLVALALIVCGNSLSAQEANKEPTTGKILLLRSGQVVEGDIRRVGTQICIRNGMSEILLGADKALRICTDWEDAYVFMQTAIKLSDPNARVRLARWCQMRNLPDRALEQARIALALQQGHQDAKQLVAALDRAQLETTPPKEPPIVPAAPAPKPAQPGAV